MKPQSAPRKTLCSQKEGSFKDKTEQMALMFERFQVERTKKCRTKEKMVKQSGLFEQFQTRKPSQTYMGRFPSPHPSTQRGEGELISRREMLKFKPLGI